MVAQNINKKERKIHSYKVLGTNQKKEALEELLNDPSQENFVLLSKKFDTTTRNLRRWFNQGYMRKGGCGRKKINPEGIIRLEEWILDETRKLGKKISRNQIKEQAIKIFNIESFKASKAWMDKFIKEQNLKLKIRQILLEKGVLSKCQVQKHKQFQDSLKEKECERSTTKKQLKRIKLEEMKAKYIKGKLDQLLTQDFEIGQNLIKQDTIKIDNNNKEDDMYFTASFEQEARPFGENYGEQLYLGFD
ncbi:unnamed protein product (macronuclear) [Paramecium tetraurelia]|uniref:HTH CENPB-type domain-containing protein n=1 Tax=Paramecium tetraurelia TaxID=5888 RepID=A0C9I6_PARTE|nr:uncharacterized protein GSPATT00006759001 [Paramecium tetraurelia]CAK67453.1 unnamed protein product [Paramecium tetraurelia]|eukprot:XP_001434850.1 hypothetical protein (macronuclear) [Paramecium tetraurelia strain d4-2]